MMETSTVHWRKPMPEMSCRRCMAWLICGVYQLLQGLMSMVGSLFKHKNIELIKILGFLPETAKRAMGKTGEDAPVLHYLIVRTSFICPYAFVT
jgi:hypothetical protein